VENYLSIVPFITVYANFRPNFHRFCPVFHPFSPKNHHFSHVSPPFLPDFPFLQQDINKPNLLLYLYLDLPE